MPNFKVGDKVWYIPGYSGDALLVIECTIKEVDDYHRKKHPKAYLFYWLDEPVGHAIDDPFDNRDDAFKELLERYESAIEYDFNANRNAQLVTNRIRTIKFILSTHEIPTDKIQEEVNKELMLYPNKEYGKQWFNVNSLIK